MNNIKGATMIEYALLASLVAIAAATILATLGGTISAKFSSVNTTLGG